MSQLLPMFKNQPDVYQPSNSLTPAGLAANGMSNLKEVHQLFYPSLLKYLTVLLRNETEAEELIMELFVAVWNDKGLNLNLKDLEICLFKTARTIAIAFLKQSHILDIEELLFDQPVIRFIETDIEQSHRAAAKKLEELNELEPLEREIICLQWCGGFDLYQISQITGKSYKSILTF